MQSDAEYALSEHDRGLLKNELDRHRSNPRARDPQVAGCGMAFLGMLVLTLTPAVGAWIEVPLPVGTAVFVLAVVAIFGGALWSLLRGGLRGRQATRSAVEASVGPILAHLEDDGSRDAALQSAAHLILELAYLAPPGAARVMRETQLAQRLGRAGVDVLREVERYLLTEDNRLRPWFTADSGNAAS